MTSFTNGIVATTSLGVTGEQSDDIPYCINPIYLPTNCRIPSINFSLPRTVTFLDSNKTYQSLNQLLISLEATCAELEYHVIAPHEVYKKLTTIKKRFDQVCALSDDDEARSLKSSNSRNSSKRAMEKNDFPKSEGEREGFNIYDEYFNFVRVPELTISQFASQILSVSRDLVMELRFSSIDGYELMILLNSMRTMVKEILARSQPQKGLATEVEKAVDQHDKYQIIWDSRSSDPEEFLRKVSFFRWRIGHQFFALATIFTNDFLVKATELFTTRGYDEKIGVMLLNTSGLFLRATTAAMHYCASMPSLVYKNIIRPSMQSQQTPEGFSGDQNFEYEHFKKTKKSFNAVILGDIPELSEFVKQAVNDFNLVYVVDMVEHTGIAHMMVQGAPSITQDTMQKGLPMNVKRKDAVRQLLEMAIDRNEEIKN